MSDTKGGQSVTASAAEKSAVASKTQNPQEGKGYWNRFTTWVSEHPGYFVLMIISLISFGLLIWIATCSCTKWNLTLGDTRPNEMAGDLGDLGITGVYESPVLVGVPSTDGVPPVDGVPSASGVPPVDGCPPLATEYAPHSDLVPPYQRATQGADQPHMHGHPLERQARAVHQELYNHPNLPCYEPANACYDPAQGLLTETPSMVPSYQQRLKELPAMRQLNLQQENPATGFGKNARQGIDTLSSTSLDRQNDSDSDSLNSRVMQTAGAANGLAGIYGRGDTKGISMINQKSRMTDPTKMLPRADPSQEQHRMVQAGPSIADIGCRVPKATDLMRMMRGGSSVLSNTIPRDKPPVYTEGLNAYRPTRLPARTVQGDCLFGISPLEISDIVDYRPNPFLYGSRGYGSSYSYAVPGAAAASV